MRPMPLGARMLATLYILISNENQGVKNKNGEVYF